MNWKIVKSHGEEGDMIELFGNGNLLLRKRLVRTDESESGEDESEGDKNEVDDKEVLVRGDELKNNEVIDQESDDEGVDLVLG